MAVCLIIIQVAPVPILKIFKATDDMLNMGIPAMRILSSPFIFAGLAIACSGVFQALGKGIYSMIVSMARQLFVLVPAAYILAKATHNVTYVWFAFPIAEIFSMVLSLVLFAYAYRKIIKPLDQEKISLS